MDKHRRSMTEEQMQVLQQQIAAYIVLQERLQNWYASLPSHVDPNIVDPNQNYYINAAKPLPRRTRWSPTPEQLGVLEQEFATGNVNPGKPVIKNLAVALAEHGEITEINVYNWFQNRRARSKKKKRQQQEQDNNVASEMASETSSKSSSGAGNDPVSTTSEQLVDDGGDHGTDE